MLPVFGCICTELCKSVNHPRKDDMSGLANPNHIAISSDLVLGSIESGFLQATTRIRFAAFSKTYTICRSFAVWVAYGCPFSRGVFVARLPLSLK